MRLIRFRHTDGLCQMAALDDQDTVYPLPFASFAALSAQLRKSGGGLLEPVLQAVAASKPVDTALSDLTLVDPVAAPEVWAAGVTYERSREARNYETTQSKEGSQTFYDKVYDAPRPELFFKSTAGRTVGPGGTVCLRNDSQWQIPEPELGLVVGSDGAILGYTIGNDMSCRDIEGENPLYLPQAKVWKQSCSIGPFIRLAESVPDPYNLAIACRIVRNDGVVFEGEANTRQLKRRFDELVSFLLCDNVIFEGTVLLTGTCIVPPNEFSLAAGDRIEISIESLGVLVNSVALA